MRQEPFPLPRRSIRMTLSELKSLFETKRTIYLLDFCAFRDHGMVVFEEPPQISVTDSKMQISCTLKQRGEVSLSTIPKVVSFFILNFNNEGSSRYFSTFIFESRMVDIRRPSKRWMAIDTRLTSTQTRNT